MLDILILVGAFAVPANAQEVQRTAEPAAESESIGAPSPARGPRLRVVDGETGAARPDAELFVLDRAAFTKDEWVSFGEHCAESRDWATTKGRRVALDENGIATIPLEDSYAWVAAFAKDASGRRT